MGKREGMGAEATPTPAPPATALVLSDTEERVRLRELVAALSTLRDRIAEADLEIESLRDALGTFEASYHARLAIEHDALSRIERLIAHMERWGELLREPSVTKVKKKARHLTKRRERELEEQATQAAEREEAAQVEEAPRASPDERLKAAYRGLARRYHPDLAHTEEERVRFGELMARINGLYRAGDLERLETMAEQARGGDIDTPDLGIDEQIATLAQRRAWFEAVLRNLADERAAIERSPTCELWRNAQQAELSGRDLVGELQGELRARVESSYPHVASAAKRLEAALDEFNRKHATALPERRQSRALERRFDPFSDKRLVRLGLEQLRHVHCRPEAHALAARIEERAATAPAVLRLVLLTYVSELSPFPLSGLETYDDVALRFRALRAEDEPELAFEQALVQADGLVELGVKRASEKVMRLGLRFVTELTREAVLVLLTSIPVRRELKRVLGVLGERERCPRCKKEIFAVPLFRTHGLDDLRALVCPGCGHTLRSYWMPKGKDVQAVLNAAFLDFEIVSEWSFSLARGSFGTQLLPLEVEKLTLGDLAERVFHDVFARYELELTRSHLELWKRRTRLDLTAPLTDFIDTSFTIRFAEGAKLREAEALEILRHRARNRFKSP